MAGMVEPVRVSPFIKTWIFLLFLTPFSLCACKDSCLLLSFACPQWTMLISGIFYGATKYQALKKKQTAIRDEYEKTRPEREAKNKALRESLRAAELQMLSDVTGSKFE